MTTLNLKDFSYNKAKNVIYGEASTLNMAGFPDKIWVRGNNMTISFYCKEIIKSDGDIFAVHYCSCYNEPKIKAVIYND